MRLRLLISLNLLLFCAAQKMCAQLAPADDFFHSGARFYLSNNIALAQSNVDTGLKIYPDDEKLKALDKLLKQQSQQQSQQQNQKDQQSQSQKDQKQNQSPSQKSPDQPKPDEQKKGDEKKDDSPKPADQPQPSPGKKDGEKPDNKNGEGQPLAPGQMTPEEAKKLLDAQKDNEQVLQLKPDGKPRDNRKPVKDW